jgi:NAD(P)-dependent dehydrogenase (short-subunit alcohol dehydrogenase family)
MQTALVTGANRGIGLALVQQLRSRGDEVIGVCRRGSAALTATGARVESDTDVTDAQALGELAQNLGSTQLDALWLNAGILERENLGAIDAAGFDSLRRQFEVNALGPLRVVQAMLRHLRRGSKVAIITSRMGSIADNDSGGYYGYRASKAAVNAIGKSLAVDLEPRGIGVFMLHPGYVATDMVGGGGDISPAQAAERLVGVLDGLSNANSGTFWHSNGAALPW